MTQFGGTADDFGFLGLLLLGGFACGVIYFVVGAIGIGCQRLMKK